MSIISRNILSGLRILNAEGRGTMRREDSGIELTECSPSGTMSTAEVATKLALALWLDGVVSLVYNHGERRDYVYPFCGRDWELSVERTTLGAHGATKLDSDAEATILITRPWGEQTSECKRGYANLASGWNADEPTTQGHPTLNWLDEQIQELLKRVPVDENRA